MKAWDKSEMHIFDLLFLNCHIIAHYQQIKFTTHESAVHILLAQFFGMNFMLSDACRM